MIKNGLQFSQTMGLASGSAKPQDISGLAAWYKAETLAPLPIDPGTLSGVVARYRADQFTTGGAAPNTISGCVAWYRADIGITLNGSTVSAWASIVGDSSHTVSQGTAGKQPTFNATDAAYNNQPTLSFARASIQSLISGTWNVSLSQPFTILVIGNNDGAATTQYFLDDKSGSNYATVYNTAGGGVASAIYSGSILSSPSTATNAPQIIAGTFNGASSTLYDSSNTALASGSVGSGGTVQGLVIGCYGGDTNSGSWNLNGKIAEVAVFNRVLSDAEIKSIIYYAAVRYKLGISIGSMVDTSGVNDSTHNLAQATYSKMPTLTVADSSYSNQPSLSFVSASSQSLVSATWTIAISQPNTIIVIGNDDGVGASQCFFSGTANGQLLNTSGSHYNAYAGTALNSNVSITSAPKVFASIFNGNSGSVYVNGNVANATGAIGAATEPNLYVGSQSDGVGSYLNGKIVEVIAFNRALSQAEINGIQIYASNRYGIGVKIGAWSDQSGLNDSTHNAAQSAYTVQPTLNISDATYNNQPTLSFVSASNQELKSSTWSAALTSPHTVFVVGNDDGTTTQQLYVDNEAGTECLIANNNAGGHNNYTMYSGTGYIFSSVAESNAPRVLAAITNGANSTLYVTAKTAAVTGNAGTASRTGITIGGYFGGSATLNGKIAEVIVYNRALSQNEINTIMDYLSSKYNIAMGA